jgi:hypothetical protein
LQKLLTLASVLHPDRKPGTATGFLRFAPGKRKQSPVCGQDGVQMAE